MRIRIIGRDILQGTNDVTFCTASQAFHALSRRRFCSAVTKVLETTQLTEKRAELSSILSTLLDKKAVQILNHPKTPDTAWPIYDLAVRLDYEMVKRQGRPVPIHLSHKIKKSVIKLDQETQRQRLYFYAKMHEYEKLQDEITLEKLEKEQKIYHEFVRRLREERPDYDVRNGMKTLAGYHVLGPRFVLDGAFSMGRADRLSSGNLLFARDFGQNFVIG